MSFTDPTPQQLASLSDEMRPIAIEIINILREAGIPAIIVSQGARRSSATQSKIVAAGNSLTTKSAHLTGDAFDIDIYGLSRSQIPDAFWKVYGPLVESYGLSWGGRWHSLYDPGHAELPRSARRMA